MTKIGTKPEEWKSKVNSGEDAVKSIKDIKKITLEKTDLKPFTKISEVIDQMNKSVAVFKGYSKIESDKMVQASVNKKNDDVAYSGSNVWYVGGKMSIRRG